MVNSAVSITQFYYCSKYGEDNVNQDSPVSVIVNDKVRVEFLRNGFCEYEYTASYNCEVLICFVKYVNEKFLC